MPFKAFASPKKLANLGEQVVAVAADEKDRVTAALTTDPVQLASIPFNGNKRITNVSLDEANDVALISKAVAVVKTGHDLWALLGIQHKSPKMEQIGRDIRSLHAAPGGGTALALGWDGNGASLAFQNNEVGGRQFVVRGDVRTASLTFDRCYVVVDAEGGAQFREHPGATPESGALARADLPAETKSYDRLAGGEKLAALTGRGKTQVCVLRRENPGAYSAEMLDVGAEVIDVAVIDTSLFVLGADGEVRLYNSEALATPGAQPTTRVGLKGNGTPTCMCSTSKGGAKLWVGTRGGDVIQCVPVKGGLDL